MHEKQCRKAASTLNNVEDNDAVTVASASEAPRDRLEIGCRVKVQGLIGNTALNGKEAIVVRLRIAGSDRCHVIMRHSNESISILPDNLEFVADAFTP